jgi:flavin reductase (DIM6/NTAB) family NADH-FMN oxidoreductase RutF
VINILTDRYQSIASLLSKLNPELWVVTASNGQQHGGLIATFAVPASIVFTQPRMLLGIARHHHTWEIIEQSQRFALHLISEQQINWIQRFGAQSGHDVDKFASLDMEISDNGNPLLTEAIGWLECSVETKMDTGDRTVYLGEIVGGTLKYDAKPLTVKYLYEHASPSLIETLNQLYSKDGIIDFRNIQDWRRHLAR